MSITFSLRSLLVSDDLLFRNEDDLTVKLSEIIYANALIKMGLTKGVSTQNLMEQWEFLQVSVALYINSELPGMPKEPVRSLDQLSLTSY